MFYNVSFFEISGINYSKVLKKIKNQLKFIPTNQSAGRSKNLHLRTVKEKCLIAFEV